MSVTSKLFAAFLCFFILTGFESGERIFAPGPDLWQRWEAHDPESTKTIDHTAWTKILQAHRHIDETDLARFDYGAMTAPERAVLDTYLEGLANVPISTFSRAEQFAYWLNLYNALTIDLVLDHYPVASIKDIDISPGLFASGPWGAELITVEGAALTLNDIEHRILRPIWKDPRIHYGVNCASIGCPNLLERAFAIENLDSMLEEAARAYVNSPRGVAIGNDQITVSRIYDWFIEDFGESESGILSHLIQYAEPDLATELRRIGSLSATEYDWSLNDIR